VFSCPVPHPNHLSTDLTQHPAAAGFFIAFLPAAGRNPLCAPFNFSTNGATDAYK
jgi:hypothetical protein